MSKARRLFVGVDWFTATSENDNVGMMWSRIVHKRKDKVKSPSLEIKDWRNRWYSGIDVAGLAWGYSEKNGYILIAKGKVALEYWSECLPMAGRITRVDLQVTVLLPEANPDLVRNYYDDVRERKGRKYSIIQNSRGGQTLYVGSRHSDQFGRIYDKGVKEKSHKPGNLWRFEVQVNKPRANALVADMLVRERQGEEMDIPVKSYVWNWFNSRSVRPAFSPSDNSLVAEVGKDVTTVDRKLNWLRTQVRPTLYRLISDGLGRDALDSLGLSQLYEIQLKLGGSRPIL